MTGIINGQIWRVYRLAEQGVTVLTHLYIWFPYTLWSLIGHYRNRCPLFFLSNTFSYSNSDSFSTSSGTGRPSTPRRQNTNSTTGIW